MTKRGISCDSVGLMLIETAITIACMNPLGPHTFPKTDPDCYQTTTEEIVSTVPDPAWESFVHTPQGVTFENNGGSECVALSNHYIENLMGLPHIPIWSASEIWTEYDRIPEIYKQYKRSELPVVGSIVVMSGGEYDPTHGHTGVVIQVNDNGTFVSLEQNVNGDRSAAPYVRSMENVSGFLVPHDNPAVPEVVKSSKVTVMPYTGNYNEYIREHYRGDSRPRG